MSTIVRTADMTFDGKIWLQKPTVLLDVNGTYLGHRLSMVCR